MNNYIKSQNVGVANGVNNNNGKKVKNDLVSNLMNSLVMPINEDRITSPKQDL